MGTFDRSLMTNDFCRNFYFYKIFTEEAVDQRNV